MEVDHVYTILNAPLAPTRAATMADRVPRGNVAAHDSIAHGLALQSCEAS